MSKWQAQFGSSCNSKKGLSHRNLLSTLVLSKMPYHFTVAMMSKNGRSPILMDLVNWVKKFSDQFSFNDTFTVCSLHVPLFFCNCGLCRDLTGNRGLTNQFFNTPLLLQPYTEKDNSVPYSGLSLSFSLGKQTYFFWVLYIHNVYYNEAQ